MKKRPDNTDIELVELIKSGDTTAFNELYVRYAERLKTYVSYHRTNEVDDIIQEAFYRLWAQRDRIMITCSVSAFLYSIVRHILLNTIRSDKVRHKFEGLTIYDINENPFDIERHVNVLDVKRLIKREIDRMPVKQRMIFKLSRFQYKSVGDISNQFHLSPRNVNNYISLSLRSIRHIRNYYAPLRRGTSKRHAA
jgi:RNA polymerase sigma factor (sigma-70 family)